MISSSIASIIYVKKKKIHRCLLITWQYRSRQKKMWEHRRPILTQEKPWREQVRIANHYFSLPLTFRCTRTECSFNSSPWSVDHVLCSALTNQGQVEVQKTEVMK